MKATLIREYVEHSKRKLYRLDRPYTYERTKETVTSEYVVVSATDAPFSGPETYVFQCDEDGVIINWTELPGSIRGDYSHEEIIEAFCRAAEEEGQ